MSIHCVSGFKQFGVWRGTCIGQVFFILDNCWMCKNILRKSVEINILSKCLFWITIYDVVWQKSWVQMLHVFHASTTRKYVFCKGRKWLVPWAYPWNKPWNRNFHAPPLEKGRRKYPRWKYLVFPWTPLEILFFSLFPWACPWKKRAWKYFHIWPVSRLFPRAE